MRQKALPEMTPPADLETGVNQARSFALLGKVSSSALGLKDEKAALQILMQALNVPSCGASLDQSERLMAAVGMLREIGPNGALESLLAVQMMGVHNAALMFLRSATADGQDFEARDANVVRAVRLMRLFNEQLETMQKLKGKTGQQKVTVEHVHVHEGGKAIVGAVSTGEGQLEVGER